MSDPIALTGPKILLQGDSGSGKTFAFGPLVDWAARQDPPIEVFILFTENGMETLRGYWRDRKLPIPANLHYHHISAPTLSLASLMDAAQKVGMLSYEALTKMTDGNRSSNNPYYRILQALSDFPDDVTGKKFGNVGSWGADKILCVDSLTMLGDAAMKMQVGNKPTASPSDYGVVQNNLMNLLRFFTQGFAPTFVMTAHLQRMTNEVTGGVQLMTKAVGKAMSDDIPPLFSEVLFSYREGKEWFWDTAAPNVTTKTRYLPIMSKIKPDLGQIMDKWKARGE